MNIGIVLLSAGVVAAVLINDLGRRAVTRRRLVRPLVISAAVVAFFIGAPASSGTGLLLEVAGVAAGLAVGACAALAMRVDSDGAGHVVTVAGVAYAATWTGLAAARLAFAWAAQNVFPATMGHWLAANQVSGSAFTDAFILFAISSVVARTASIAWRGRTRAGGRLVPAL